MTNTTITSTAQPLHDSATACNNCECAAYEPDRRESEGFPPGSYVDCVCGHGIWRHAR